MLIFSVARTRDEAHLYLDLQPCEECGSNEVAWKIALVEFEGRPVNRYSGACAGCGTWREFYFTVAPHEVMYDGRPTFGGKLTSELLDPGEWLWVADRVAGDAPPDKSGEALAIAAAAVDEALKFVQPGGDAVPDEAFWSDRGQEVHAAEPSRFQRDRLLALRSTYRQRAGLPSADAKDPTPDTTMLPRARTLLEANLYIKLVVHGLGALAADLHDAGREDEPWTVLIEGKDAWTLQYDRRLADQSHRFYVMVPYQTEWESRRDHVRFGHGVSEVIDAGQWLVIRAAFARRALRDSILFTGTPDDPERFREVVQRWELALAAGEEMAKFLPDDAEEVPSEEFWTDMGRAFRQTNLDRFTRAQLERDRAFHLQNLQGFLADYGDRHSGA